MIDDADFDYFSIRSKTGCLRVQVDWAELEQALRFLDGFAGGR
jgi:hypothetical protein